jgi:hypothetical protein
MDISVCLGARVVDRRWQRNEGEGAKDDKEKQEWRSR